MNSLFKEDVKKISEKFLDYSFKDGYDTESANAMSFRWEKSARLETDANFVQYVFEDYLFRYGFKDIREFEEFLSPFETILEIGAGEGKCVDWYLNHSRAHIFALEISNSVYYLNEKYKNEPRVTVIKADAAIHPFKNNTLDFISIEQAISNAPDAHGIFNSLCRALKPGGKIILCLFNRKSFIRQKMDKIIRDNISKLPPERILDISYKFSEIGKILHDCNVEVEIPENFIEFGTLAGKKISLQRFFYYAVFKCFYNPSFTMDKNAEYNLDWYSYPHCNTYVLDEVCNWFFENDMQIEHINSNEANFSIRAIKRT
ncbi:MAG: class I SAM-dependent methyltransferase [Bacteroidia bacterium]|nr:class I SAM-dependent methyltransferase [Bacteroidia bacterium]